MRLWSRPLIVAGIGVVPQGPEEGPPTGTHSGPAHQGTATRRPEIRRGHTAQQ